jgi:inosine triphosphate pyrophosphatase
MKDFTFITGNQNKADYLAKLLGLDVKHYSLDLDEIQSVDLKEVVSHKARQAFAITGAPALVEDVSLEFNALSGLPGTFIKFFVENAGLEETCRMLDGFSDRSAVARCAYAYYDGNELTIIEGSIKGDIAPSPSGGTLGFGWDKIFIPEGYGGRVRSDLEPDEYDALYLKIKPIEKLRIFLSGN